MDIDIINKIASIGNKYSNARIEELLELYKKTPTGKPVVAVFGVLKAGKSTFLNALIGDKTNSTFAHGATRTTIENKLFDYNNIKLMDTPGIDANNMDDLVTFDGLKSIDYILFIHNPKMGELDANEVAFMQKISKFFGSEISVVNKMLFVLTHQSALNDEDKVDIVGKINSQLKDIFYHSAEFLFVESLSYIKGLNENKKILLEASSVDKVRGALESKIETTVLMREQRKSGIISNLMQELESVRNFVRKEKIEKEKSMAKIVDETNLFKSKIEH